MSVQNIYAAAVNTIVAVMAVTIAAVRPIHPKVSPFPGPTGQAMRTRARNTLWDFYYGAVRHEHTSPAA